MSSAGPSLTKAEEATARQIPEVSAEGNSNYSPRPPPPPPPSPDEKLGMGFCGQCQAWLLSPLDDVRYLISCTNCCLLSLEEQLNFLLLCSVFMLLTGAILPFIFFSVSSSEQYWDQYVLSVLKFTYPTLFQGWQTLVGGCLLHISWKIGWVEIGSISRSEVLSWLPASALYVGIIYSGSRALSRLPIPIFLTLHNAAEILSYGIEAFVQKEQISALKISRVLILLAASACLPIHDPQFDTYGYFWALVHLLCVGAYKAYHKSWKPSSMRVSEEQYINYAFSVVMLAFASHPTGDLSSALEFPFLFFYRFHGSCFASGLFGFLLTFHTMKLKSSTSSGQYVIWSFFAKVVTAALSPFFFGFVVNIPTICCLLLGGFAEVLLLYMELPGT